MAETEVWFRNPEKFLHLVVEAGGTKILWHHGRLLKRRVDPLAHARMFFPMGVSYRMLVADVRGCLEYDQGSTEFTEPRACYPVWHYGEPLEALETMLETNVGVSGEPLDDDLLFTPVHGQEHRVLVAGWPNLSTNVGKRFAILLSEMQRDYPETIIHLFEARSYKIGFGLGFKSTDLDPATDARYSKVYLANGRRYDLEMLQGSILQWVHLHGYTVPDLWECTDNRISFNIQSAMWAGAHYADRVKFRATRSSPNPEEIDLPSFAPPRTQSHKSDVKVVSVPGDKVACDSCSLQDTCKYARAGSVCTLTDSETAGLARFFNTRDSDQIIDGLSAILQVQAQRAERGMAEEAAMGELNSETSSVLRTMFEGGVKLARLINPALVPHGNRIAVQINQGSTGVEAITAANPKALMAALVRELEDRGIPRQDITPEMVMGMVAPKQIVEVNEC